MKLLEERILRDGKVLSDDILKVDMFLNHQIDVGLLNEIGKEFYRLFQSAHINKILTIEASGIGIACIAAQYFSVPVVFAKKGAHRNVGGNLYTSEVFSFTKNKSYLIGVSKDYLGLEDHVLIIDDFLANGRALIGLKDILDQAGAKLEGIGIVIEKGFQPGGKLIRSMGIHLESLAIVESMQNGAVTFALQDC
uniref:xanthine phosphoribosyltransferase n=1 Tax=Candidatus Fimivicinus sp. TaxID=3056640 RepID=UPI003FEF2693